MCRHLADQDWLLRRQELLLAVPYFLLTFTLPAEITSFGTIPGGYTEFVGEPYRLQQQMVFKEDWG